MQLSCYTELSPFKSIKICAQAALSEGKGTDGCAELEDTSGYMQVAGLNTAENKHSLRAAPSAPQPRPAKRCSSLKGRKFLLIPYRLLTDGLKEAWGFPVLLTSTEPTGYSLTYFFRVIDLGK